MKPLILILFFLLNSMLSLSQDTTYINRQYEPVLVKTEANYYRIDTPDTTGKVDFIRKIYQLNHQIASEGPYIFEEGNREKPVIHGTEITWYETGELLSKRDFQNGRSSKNGRHEMYWQNGQPKRLDIFEDGQLIKGVCYNEEGKETDYFLYEEQPMFPGGVQKLYDYLSTPGNLKLPKKIPNMKRGTIRVFSKFTVKIDGTIDDISIVKGDVYPFNEVVIKAIMNMPKWTPGTIDGKPVNAQFVLPVTFEID